MNFGWGLLLFPPPLVSNARFLSSRIGGEKVLLLSASAWGFLTVITPLLTHISSAHLVFMTCSRFLMGLLQGETRVLSTRVCLPTGSLLGAQMFRCKTFGLQCVNSCCVFEQASVSKLLLHPEQKQKKKKCDISKVTHKSFPHRNISAEHGLPQ